MENGAEGGQGADTKRGHSRIPGGVIPLLVLAMGAGALAWFLKPVSKGAAPPAAKSPIRTRVRALAPEDYPVMVRTHGVVKPRDESTLSSQVSARIIRISESFQDGAFFPEGHVLLELDPADFKNAVAVAEARVLTTQAGLKLAKLNHERDASLVREKLAPVTQLDVAAARLQEAEADVKAADAQLERSRRDLERTVILAPYRGCVRRRTVGLGQLVGPGTTLGSIFAVDAFEVRLPVGSREQKFLGWTSRVAIEGRTAGERPMDAGFVPASEVELQDAIDRESTQIWKGRIVRSEGALDENSLEMYLIAQITDPLGLQSGGRPLRIGQPVTAMIRGMTLTNVVALPRNAVRQLDQVVFVNPTNLTLKPKTIVPVWSDESNMMVLASQVDAGDLLSMTHLLLAPKGAKVEIIPDITNSPVSSPGAKETTGKGKGSQ